MIRNLLLNDFLVKLLNVMTFFQVYTVKEILKIRGQIYILMKKKIILREIV